MNDGRARRVLMIALDALEVRWLDRWAGDGDLPNLRQFMETTQRMTVRSEGTTLHGSVWPTFASGTGPGHHGIYWWTQWLAEEARYVRNSHGALHYTPFWSAAVDAGRRAVVIDVPYTPSLRRPGAWTANGWGLHDEMMPDSYPEKLLPAIRRRYGDHPLRADTMHSMAPAAKRKMAAAMVRGAEMRTQLISDFAARRDWDFFIASYSETHKAGHYLAEPEDLGDGATNDSALLSVLRPLDRALPGIVERAGPDCDVFLFALHGMVPQVDYSWAGSAIAALAEGRPVAGAVPPPDLVRRVRNILPAQVQSALWLALPPRVRSRRFGATAARGHSGDEGIFTTTHDGSVALRLGLEGRERDGHISPEEGEALLQRVAAIADAATVDSGLPAFGELLRIHERFPGPRAHRLPEALLLLAPGVLRTATVTLPGGEVLHSPGTEARNGVHTSEGFCFYRPGGPGDVTRTTVDSRDFAPSVLALLGATPPSTLQGESFLG